MFSFNNLYFKEVKNIITFVSFTEYKPLS